MAVSFLQGRCRRVVFTGVALYLSMTSVSDPKNVNGQDAPDNSAQSGRAILREAEMDDKAQYPGLTIVKAGNSSTAVRKQAIHELSLERMAPAAQRKSQAILNNLGMFRRLPTISFECDPDVYHYFLNNPDVAVSTWRAMGISQFQLQQTGTNQYRADAGDGSIGNIEILLQSPTEVVIHCDGAFKSPLLPKPIVARSLMRVQTSFSKEQDGRIIGTHSGEVYVEFPSQTVEAVAKVISPVSHLIADRNFKQMTLFVHLMSQAMAKNPGWIEQTGQRLEGVSKQKRMEFLDVATKSFAESRKRPAIVTNPQTFSPDEVLTPYRQVSAESKSVGTVQLPSKTDSSRAVQTANQTSSSSQKN
jgi:hypothetical protein